MYVCLYSTLFTQIVEYYLYFSASCFFHLTVYSEDHTTKLLEFFLIFTMAACTPLCGFTIVYLISPLRMEIQADSNLFISNKVTVNDFVHVLFCITLSLG